MNYNFFDDEMFCFKFDNESTAAIDSGDIRRCCELLCEAYDTFPAIYRESHPMFSTIKSLEDYLIRKKIIFGFEIVGFNTQMTINNAPTKDGLGVEVLYSKYDPNHKFKPIGNYEMIKLRRFRYETLAMTYLRVPGYSSQVIAKLLVDAYDTFPATKWSLPHPMRRVIEKMEQKLRNDGWTIVTEDGELAISAMYPSGLVKYKSNYKKKGE